MQPHKRPQDGSGDHMPQHYSPKGRRNDGVDRCQPQKEPQDDDVAVQRDDAAAVCCSIDGEECVLDDDDMYTKADLDADAREQPSPA